MPAHDGFFERCCRVCFLAGLLAGWPQTARCCSLAGPPKGLVPRCCHHPRYHLSPLTSPAASATRHWESGRRSAVLGQPSACSPAGCSPPPLAGGGSSSSTCRSACSSSPCCPPW